MSIRNVIPLLGVQEIDLYDPSDKIYRELKKRREIRRLNTLRHLGSLSHALPGSRHMRWDYTASMLYYSSVLKVQGGNSAFKLGNIDFTSLASALQSVALVWNIGHLPGTFSVEKGICRYLYTTNPFGPADVLDWPHASSAEVQRFIRRANEVLKANDYLDLARVLAVVKLLSYCTSTDGFLYEFTTEFAAPFLLSMEDESHPQWAKLRAAFALVRHAAYLTLDYAIAGIDWAPHVNIVVRDQLKNENISVRDLSVAISEILSPLERQIYQKVYHSDAARKETAVVANRVHTYLMKNKKPVDAIKSWMRFGLYQHLNLGRGRGHYQIAASMKLRSHFSGLPGMTSKQEEELARRGIHNPLISMYNSWNSDAMIEPDEFIVDSVTDGKPETSQVGRLIVWCIDNFEDFSASYKDSLQEFRKRDLDSTYIGLIQKAVSLKYPGISIRVEPWELEKFKVYHDTYGSRISVWAGDATLGDSVIRYIVRDRSNVVPSNLREKYAELRALAGLRRQFRRKWARRIPRQRCLFVTASIRFMNDIRDLIEFDGGILTVSARGGKMTWYGLETKSRGTDPVRSLRSRLNALDINSTVSRVAGRGIRSAYVELRL